MAAAKSEADARLPFERDILLDQEVGSTEGFIQRDAAP